MKFNEKGFDSFRGDLQKAVEEVERKHGVKITFGNITYSGVDFTMKLTATKNEDGLDVEKVKFEDVCHLYGFSKKHYKCKLPINGKVFELVGFNERSPKNRVVIRCVDDGKMYKCTLETARRAYFKLHGENAE